jgi:Na+/proline symporter
VIDPSDAGGQQDYFLSARKSSPSGAVALSWFASGMGTWILFGTPELGANPTLSWLAIIGYSLSAALPALILVCIGPLVRRATEKERAYSTGDFARTRYGRLMQLTTAVMSLFYMFIFLCSEMTAISSVFSTLTNNYSKKYMESITISIGVFTIFYTTIAGLPASIISDKFQAVMIIVLMIILFSAVMAVPENRVSPSQFKKVSNWTVDGLIVGITICIAVVSAELFDQGLWQRVWAAESDKAIQRGFFISSAMAFVVMMFFGIMGMIGYAKDPVSYDS